MSVGRSDEAAWLGILTKYDPIELIEGLLITKIRKTPLHCVSTNLLRTVLVRLVPEGSYTSLTLPSQPAIASRSPTDCFSGAISAIIRIDILARGTSPWWSRSPTPP